MSELRQVPIGDIRPYAKNPRRNDASVDAVANSIREFGFRAPIIVDKDGVIIAGHTRWKAARKLKLKTVPVIYAEDMTPEQVEAYRIADNSAGSASEWDYDLLGDVLQTVDFDMSDFGLDIFRTEDGVDFSNLEAMKDQEHTEEYDAFLDKFKEKHTTDDCFTPPAVYEAVRAWAFSEYGIPKDRTVLRPFYPGGDFESFDYSAGGIVLDNPPFSILKKIVRFYIDRDIDFFLFADARTVGCYFEDCNVVLPGFNIEYENGATVNTAFITNMGKDKIRVAATLYQRLDEAQPEITADLQAYSYPDNLVTSMTLSRLAKYGSDFGIEHIEFVKKMDCGQEIYGGGALVSDPQAEKVKAEKVKIIIELSERERESAEAQHDGGTGMTIQQDFTGEKAERVAE